MKEVEVDHVGKLECVSKFCYLGDMIGSSVEAEKASRARVRCAWGKFRERASILTSRGASLKVKRKVYSACVQCVMTYGSETWPMRVKDMRRLERAEKMMIRWMCGVTLRDGKPSEENSLGIVSVSDLVRQGRLRWFGHVERKDADDWVSACRNMAVSGERGRGRGSKTWKECVADDMRQLRLRQEDAQDRAVWRNGILGNRPTRTSAEIRTLNDDDYDYDDICTWRFIDIIKRHSLPCVQLPLHGPSACVCCICEHVCSAVFYIIVIF